MRVQDSSLMSVRSPVGSRRFASRRPRVLCARPSFTRGRSPAQWEAQGLRTSEPSPLQPSALFFFSFKAESLAFVLFLGMA